MTRAQLLSGFIAPRRGIVVAVASVAVAFAISPLTPIGGTRARAQSGLRIDVAAIVVGAAAVAVARPGGSVHLQARPEVSPGGIQRRTPSRGASTHHDQRRPARTRAGTANEQRPTAATVLSATVAVAVVAVALTFTASLQHLFSTPRLYGQNWDYRTNADVPRPRARAPTVDQRRCSGRRGIHSRERPEGDGLGHGRRQGRIGPWSRRAAAGEDRRARSSRNTRRCT
jgi:hypothetical protein